MLKPGVIPSLCCFLTLPGFQSCSLVVIAKTIFKSFQFIKPVTTSVYKYRSTDSCKRSLLPHHSTERVFSPIIQFPIYCEISILCVFFAVHLERFRVLSEILQLSMVDIQYLLVLEKEQERVTTFIMR